MLIYTINPIKHYLTAAGITATLNPKRQTRVKYVSTQSSAVTEKDELTVRKLQHFKGHWLCLHTCFPSILLQATVCFHVVSKNWAGLTETGKSRPDIKSLLVEGHLFITTSTHEP